MLSYGQEPIIELAGSYAFICPGAICVYRNGSRVGNVRIVCPMSFGRHEET